MSKFQNLAGKVFGRLTVRERIGTKDRAPLYFCDCACGGSKKATAPALRTRAIQSCGCLQRENAAKNGIATRLRPYEASYNHLLRAARKRNLNVDISYEEFLIYTEQPTCHYCTDSVVWASYDGHNKAYNLDRKDNALGYLKSNIVVACGRCNQAKSNLFSYEEWVAMTAALRIVNCGLLESAIHTALTAHAGQVDVDGNPHFLHSVEVMLAVKNREDDLPKGISINELMAAAILHDVPEDTHVKLSDIHQNFGKRIASIVDGVTRRVEGGVKETYRDFIYRAAQDPASKLLKIADLGVNFKRLHTIPESKAKWRNKLEYKYGLAVRVLTSPEPTTWEQQSYKVIGGRCYMADPNGKEIEVTPEELRTALA